MVQCKSAPPTAWIYSLYCIKTICMVEDHWIALGKHIIIITNPVNQKMQLSRKQTNAERLCV